MLSRFVAKLKFISLVACAACFAYIAWQSRSLILSILQNAQPGYLVLAVCAWTVSHLTAPAGVAMIFRCMGLTVPYRFTLTTHLSVLPARYLPGGIWHTVGRGIQYHQYGIESGQVTVAIFLEMALSLGLALLLGGGTVWYFRGTEGWLGLAAAVLLWMSLIGLAVTPVLVRLTAGKTGCRFSLPAYLKTVGANALFVCIGPVAFIFYLQSFQVLTTNVSTLEIAGTYLYSWGIGYLAFFAPQGIGVFEVVAGTLLAAPIALGSVTVLIAGFRLIQLTSDAAAWSLSRVFILWEKSRNR